MAEHTPEPWYVAAGEGDTAIVYARSEYGIIDRVAELTPGAAILPADVKANARLIAAAPRMLNAMREAEAGLEFAVARLDAAGKDWKMSAERQALGIVRAAIAEAEGGTDGHR